MVRVIDDLQSTLEFPEAGKAGGSPGCNRFTTGVTQSGPLLSSGILASTQRMCPEAIMDQEQRVSTALRQTRGSLPDGSCLYLLDRHGAKLARLTRLEPRTE